MESMRVSRKCCFIPTAPNGAPAGLGWQWKHLDGCLCLCLALLHHGLAFVGPMIISKVHSVCASASSQPSPPTFAPASMLPSAQNCRTFVLSLRRRKDRGSLGRCRCWAVGLLLRAAGLLGCCCGVPGGSRYWGIQYSVFSKCLFLFSASIPNAQK